MKLVMLALLAPVILSGCQIGSEARAKRAEADCQSYGYQQGSLAYSQCLERSALAYRAERQAARDRLAVSSAALTAASEAQSTPVFIAPSTAHCTSRRVGPNVQSTCY